MTRNAIPLEEVTFRVPNMVCEGCARRIRNTLASVAGVQSVKVGVWRKRVRVSFDPAQVDKTVIVRAVEGASFDVVDG